MDRPSRSPNVWRLIWPWRRPVAWGDPGLSPPAMRVTAGPGTFGCRLD